MIILNFCKDGKIAQVHVNLEIRGLFLIINRPACFGISDPFSETMIETLVVTYRNQIFNVCYINFDKTIMMPADLVKNSMKLIGFSAFNVCCSMAFMVTDLH